MKKRLTTGATGIIGQHKVQTALNKGMYVKVLIIENKNLKEYHY